MRRSRTSPLNICPSREGEPTRTARTMVYAPRVFSVNATRHEAREGTTLTSFSNYFPKMRR
jgi:hypothetical protein